MFIPEIEKQTPEQIRQYQAQKLQEQLLYLQANSPFYKKLFNEHHIDISQIKTLDDLTQIPPTTKLDLQEQNWEFLCVDKKQIADYTTTSGTSGRPVTIALTDKDVDRLSYNEYISFACANGTADDTYQLMVTIDRQFMAGMAYWQGLRQLGASVIRTGPATPALQWESILRYEPTTIVAVPSFIVKLIDYAKEHGIDLANSSVKKAVCIGENIRNQNFTLNKLGEKIVSQWNLQLFSTYASTEMQTAFTECEHGKGGHHHPDLLIVEFLDENNQPVKEGETGKLTITNLGVEGMPLLRYKTGDLCTYYYDKCACGRNTLRVSPVIGRKNQMIKYKGTTIFPQAIFDLLQGITEVQDYVLEVRLNDFETDEVILYLAVITPTDEFKDKIRSQIQSKLRVVPQIHYTTLPEILKMQMPPEKRKPSKFLDNRVLSS